MGPAQFTFESGNDGKGILAGLGFDGYICVTAFTIDFPLSASDDDSQSGFRKFRLTSCFAFCTVLLHHENKHSAHGTKFVYQFFSSMQKLTVI